ncbi:hypothetical protein KKB99_07995 [bacterium]|nr:hypothetical protein [bacterium]MBU1025932.1 hypothetical protein [bacterium]
MGKKANMMKRIKYNSDIHHRRSVRLKEYDYSKAGAYFVTMCMLNRECRLGRIRDGIVGLSKAGLMVWKTWLEIPEKFPGVDVDEFIVMPNHVHGIIVINSDSQNAVTENQKNFEISNCRGEPCVRPGFSPGDEKGEHKVRPYGGDCDGMGDKREVRPNVRPYGTLEGSLGRVIQGFKSITTVEYGKGVRNDRWPPYDKKLWQRNYYERIIRDKDELNKIREYIYYNPLKWIHDPENPHCIRKESDEVWPV